MDLLRGLASRFLGPYIKKYVPPGLDYLVRHAATVTTDPQEFMSHFAPSHDWGAVQEEWIEVQKSLDQAIEARSDVPFPDDFALELGTREILYHLMRWSEPRIVVETGVANGSSTFVILSALEKNGVGRLHSFDIRADVGSLIDGTVQERWDFHLVEGKSPTATIRSLEVVEGEIDFFLHDSYHSFAQQNSEYETALRKLSPQGFLASDDVDKSFAFIDFCADREAAPALLVDTRKVFGAITVGELSD